MWSGIVWFHSVWRKMPDDMSAAPAAASATQRERERLREAERDDRQPVGAGAERDRLAVAPRRVRPSRSTSVNSTRADRPGGVEQAEHLRPAVAVGDGREQRDRDAEQHRVDVDGVAARSAPGASGRSASPRGSARGSAAPRRAAAGRRASARARRARRGTSRRRSRTWRPARPSRSARPRAPARRSGRPLPRKPSSAEAACELLARHEPRQHRVERRALQPAGGRHPRRDDEQQPHVRVGEQRVGEQHAARAAAAPRRRRSTSRRRSCASASAPPSSAVTSSGTISASPSRPTASVDPVSS